MFTGLIEEVSKLEDIKVTSYGARIFFKAEFKDVRIGDSIAINGVCLTVNSIENQTFGADIMNETLNTADFKYLKKGDLINLERAMSATSRFDGHIVQGHIDCTAKVKSIISDGFSKRLRLICNTDLVILKGSITINGVSLTVSKLYEDGFEVSLIPETLKKTNLKNIKIQDIVNIEYDVLGKYIKKFTQNKNESKITKEFLSQNGF